MKKIASGSIVAVLALLATIGALTALDVIPSPTVLADALVGSSCNDLPSHAELQAALSGARNDAGGNGEDDHRQRRGQADDAQPER